MTGSPASTNEATAGSATDTEPGVVSRRSVREVGPATARLTVARPDPIRSAWGQNEPTQVNPIPSDPIRTDPAQPGSNLPGSTQDDTVRIDLSGADSRLFTGSIDAIERSKAFTGPGKEAYEERDEAATKSGQHPTTPTP